MSVQPLRVGVIGAGTVGREVVREFLERSTRLMPPDGAPLVLAAVAEKFTDRAIAGGIPADLLTDAPAHLVASPDIDIVVETMGGAEPAHTLVAAALAAGKHVVTANKHIVANHGPELERLARGSGATFRFEAAVGGGIPLLGPIAQDLAANRIARVRGIVNGTTNYMLTAMTREGRDYDEVLAEAQAKGYAERDPTADVEGIDALNKLVILARLAFGAWIDPAAVHNRPGTTTGQPGRPGHHRRDRGGRQGPGARRAGSSGSSPRPGSREDGAIEASVVPTAVPADSPFGRCDGVLNRVEVDASPVGRVGVRGTRRGRSGRGRRRARRPRVDRARAGLDLGGLRRRHRDLADRGPARRRRVRRGAVGRVLPGRGLTWSPPGRPGRGSSSGTGTSCPSPTRRRSCRWARARRP